jgi:hypothetical protein
VTTDWNQRIHEGDRIAYQYFLRAVSVAAACEASAKRAGRVSRFSAARWMNGRHAGFVADYLFLHPGQAFFKTRQRDRYNDRQRERALAQVVMEPNVFQSGSAIES